jgi:hypothetical protein
VPHTRKLARFSNSCVHNVPARRVVVKLSASDTFAVPKDAGSWSALPCCRVLNCVGRSSNGVRDSEAFSVGTTACHHIPTRYVCGAHELGWKSSFFFVKKEETEEKLWKHMARENHPHATLITFAFTLKHISILDLKWRA